MESYRWPLVGEFVDREAELARLEEWWGSRERMPVCLYGRRRVGKSWLLRRVAHGKPALVLAAERLAPGTQLTRFATALEPWLGVRPELPNVPSLFRVLFRLGRERQLLIAVDEFPWLLPTSEADADRELSAIQAVMEEEAGASRLKLVLCGSSISQMETLMAVRSPMHGRLVPIDVRPLRFDTAAPFVTSLDAVRRIERFALTGGMPRYLAELGSGRLRAVVCSRLLDPSGALWNEARVVLEQELRQPGVYFSILEQLATGHKDVESIAGGARVENSTVSRYLRTLADLRLVRRKLPVGVPVSSRGGHWELADPFLRTWFRFVFPFQAELEAGLDPGDLFERVVEPDLADHVAPVFEDLCREWTRANHGREAQRVASWWGRARDDLRRTGERTAEEIDVVGLGRGRVTVVGECRWRTRPMTPETLREIDEHKLPALRQAGYRIAVDHTILLFSRGGFSRGLRRLAEGQNRLRLVDAAEIAARP